MTKNQAMTIEDSLTVIGTDMDIYVIQHGTNLLVLGEMGIGIMIASSAVFG